MKKVLIIVCSWIIWFVFLFPLVDNILTRIELEKKVVGSYTSNSMINSQYSYLYSVKNLKITFLKGEYKVYYQLYSNCEKYYTNTYRCADSKENLVKTVDSKGSYSFSDGKLILTLDNNIKRKCNVYSNSIDCSNSGGWRYRKID